MFGKVNDFVEANRRPIVIGTTIAIVTTIVAVVATFFYKKGISKTQEDEIKEDCPE